VESLKNLLSHPFIIALNKNENIPDSRYKIGQYLNVSVRRLNELLIFLHAQNNGFGGDSDINEKSGRRINFLLNWKKTSFNFVIYFLIFKTAYGNLN
jgi:hypothetical protein